MVYGEIPIVPQSLVARESTNTERIETLRLELLGPQYPAGRRPEPAPARAGLPPDSGNVPTYHTTRESLALADLQLDHVLASRGFHESVQERALNSLEGWGSSDHYRLQIEVHGSAMEYVRHALRKEYG